MHVPGVVEGDDVGICVPPPLVPYACEVDLRRGAVGLGLSPAGEFGGDDGDRLPVESEKSRFVVHDGSIFVLRYEDGPMNYIL